MKRILAVTMFCLLSAAFGSATPQGSIVPVAATHQRAKRHRAHKAGKHHTPKHRHHSV